MIGTHQRPQARIVKDQVRMSAWPVVIGIVIFIFALIAGVAWLAWQVLVWTWHFIIS